MKKLILELNEFNFDLLKKASQTRPNIAAVLAKSGIAEFRIDEDYDSDYLEPWAQWITVHTGKPCTVHKIKHLGDVENLQYKQVWDLDPQKFGKVWGCLNSKSPNIDNGVKYFPDPWTKSSDTNMPKARRLQNFLRFAVSARSNIPLKNKVLIAIDALYSALWLGVCVDKKLLSIVLTKRFKLLNTSMLYAIIEYLCFKRFLKIYSDRKIDIFFSNMLAHCQHYYWNTDQHYKIEVCYDLIDSMLDLAMKNYDEIVVFNGLGQEYSGDIERWHSYVPKGGWESFVKDFLKLDVTVEPCMSYDCNLICSDPEQLKLVKHKIDQIGVQNECKLFLTEPNESDPLKLFIRLAYYGDEHNLVIFGNDAYKINDLFDLTAIRAGRHCQNSTAFGDIPNIPNLAEAKNTQAISIYQ